MKIALWPIAITALITTTGAMAAPLNFAIVGGGSSAQWTMDSETPLNFSTDFAAAYSLVPMTIDGVESLRNIQFYTPASGGGLDIFLSGEAVNFYTTGPTLFTGPTSAPTFLRGSFDLTGYFDPDTSYVLTIADAAAAVPEPASWAMMIGGFGLVGGALRRRHKGTASVRFA